MLIKRINFKRWTVSFYEGVEHKLSYYFGKFSVSSKTGHMYTLLPSNSLLGIDLTEMCAQNTF